MSAQPLLSTERLPSHCSVPQLETGIPGVLGRRALCVLWKSDVSTYSLKVQKLLKLIYHTGDKLVTQWGLLGRSVDATIRAVWVF